ncbi:MAG: AbiH family protein [Culicoidibacterales bacterium]
MGKLLIIGNGFDLAHRMATQYSDYVASNYFPFEVTHENCKCWKNYENYIGKKINEKFNSLHYEIEELGVLEEVYNSAHDEYGFYEGCIYRGLIEKNIAEKLKNDIQYEELLDEIAEFTDGLEQYLTIQPLPSKKYKLFDNFDFFLSFNYTKLLEGTYEIDNEKLFYIHGKLGQEIIIGYNSYIKKTPDITEYPEKIRYQGGDVKDFLVESRFLDRSSEMGFVPEICNEILFEVIEKLKNKMEIYDKSKFTQRRMIEDKLMKFIDDGEITKIEIFGHSLGEMDHDFFDMLNETIGKEVSVIVYAHQKKDYEKFEETILKKGWKFSVELSEKFEEKYSIEN